MPDPSTQVLHPEAARVHPKKLVLASEELKEDLAPVQPGAMTARWVLVGGAVAVALLGLAMRAGLGPQSGQPDPASIAFAAAGACAAVAALPFPYALRAGVAVVLGALMMVLGVRGLGPLGGMATDGEVFRDLARVTTMTCLPAALLFRAHYRAYRPARLVLVIALLASVPLLVGEAALAINPSVPFVVRVAAIFDMTVVACGLFGFMGHQSTGAGAVWASLVLFLLAASVALRELTLLSKESGGVLVYATTAVGTLCAATLTAFGVYQLLASALASDARSKIPRAEVEIETQTA